jgi:hypothetical protein
VKLFILCPVITNSNQIKSLDASWNLFQCRLITNRTSWPDERQRRRGLLQGALNPEWASLFRQMVSLCRRNRSPRCSQSPHSPQANLSASAKEEAAPIRHKPDRPTRKSPINRGPLFHLGSQKNCCRQRNHAYKITEGERRAYSLGPHSIV